MAPAPHAAAPAAPHFAPAARMAPPHSAPPARVATPHFAPQQHAAPQIRSAPTISRSAQQQQFRQERAVHRQNVQPAVQAQSKLQAQPSAQSQRQVQLNTRQQLRAERTLRRTEDRQLRRLPASQRAQQRGANSAGAPAACAVTPTAGAAQCLADPIKRADFAREPPQRRPAPDSRCRAARAFCVALCATQWRRQLA